MPPWWSMAYYCLDLHDGTVRHFPAGTYHEQAATREGRDELSAMQTTYNAWRTFSTPAARWNNQDRRVAAMAMPDPPEPPKPTRRLDWIIAALWPGSLWTRLIVRHMRGLDG